MTDQPPPSEPGRTPPPSYDPTPPPSYEATPPPPSYGATPPASSVAPPPYTAGPVNVAPTPVLSILSTVFGALGFLTGLVAVVGLLTGLAGLILGFIARRREPQGKVLQIIGMIAGGIGVVANLAVIAIYIAFIISAAAHSASTAP